MPAESNPLRSPKEMHRDASGRRIAGVCAALAERLNVSVTVVRAAFLLLLLPPFHFVGGTLYSILWFLTPNSPGEMSGLDRSIDFVKALVARGDAALENGEDSDPDDWHPRPDSR